MVGQGEIKLIWNGTCELGYVSYVGGLTDIGQTITQWC